MKSILFRIAVTAVLTAFLLPTAHAGLTSTFFVTSAADTADGSCDTHCTLREAITAANGSSSSTILFSEAGIFNVHQVINLTSALPAINANVEISGPTVGVTIRRDSGGDYRIFDIPNPGFTIKLERLTISNGYTRNTDGGGIRSFSYLHLNGVTVDGNQSGDRGGGVALTAGGRIENSTISNNSAGSGGGLFFEPAPTDEVLMINSTVSGNTSFVGTGIMLANFFHDNNNVTLDLSSCTIANNFGNSSGIVAYVFGATKQATVNLTSTILDSNGTQNLGQVINGGGGSTQFTSGGYNLASDAPAALNNTGDQVNLRALLGPLADNGGLTQTHALLMQSPALDQGKNPLSATDQRGLARRLDLSIIDAPPGGDQSDVGAFEQHGLMVDNDRDNSEPGSLRAAIEAANASPGGSYIRFSSDFFRNPRVIRLESPLPDIVEGLTIIGPGARLATVRRHSGGDYRIFTKHGLGYLEIFGLTLSNGKASTGGGIESRSILRLNGVVVSGNQATFGGGGVSVINTFATIIDSTLNDNRAGQGGGVAFQIDVAGNLRLVLVNSTVSGNRANLGGGLFVNNNGQNANSYVILESSTIAGNRGVGGGIRADISTGSGAYLQVTLHNTIVANPGYPNLSSNASAGNTVSFISDGFNLFSDAANGLSTTATDQHNIDPLLAPLGPNGGPTPVHALRGGSPALDQGQHGFLDYPDLDQRTLPRQFDIAGIPDAVGGDGSDIGAVEMQALLVTNNNSGEAGSLRYALYDAHDNGPGLDDILFDSEYFATPRIINLDSALPWITTGSVNLVGPGADHVNVRRNAGSEFSIIVCGAPDAYLGISDMTLSNGNPGLGGGGGILSACYLDLRRSVVSGNQANSGSGIWLTGSAVIDSSTISGNTALSGGSLVIPEARGNLVQLVNSTVSDNSADTFPGIWVSGFATPGPIGLEVLNSTIANNTGTGPALFIDADQSGVFATATVANSLFVNNSGGSLDTYSDPGGEAIINSLGNNLATDGGAGHLSEPSDLVDTDPLLDPLANYGGQTPTRRIPTNSAALDVGDCALSGVTRDQRGKYRPFDRPGSANAADGCDIGAFEWSDSDGDGEEDSNEIFHSGFEKNPL